MRVKVTTCFPEWPLERQTPGKAGVWDDCVFFVNQQVQECDWWVIYEDLLSPETSSCPVGHVVLITGEPPILKQYPPTFLAQFGVVITCHPKLAHPNIVRTQQSLPWHIGARRHGQANLGFWLDYDQLRSLSPPAKSKCISVISSDKDLTEGHRRRLAFVRRLAEHFKERLDVFGRGIQEIGDKWEALAEYQYHIVLENSAVPHYWTEKLADAYLGWTYPLYYGCPNLEEYFPPSAFLRIDIMDPEASIEKIEQAIAQQTYERQLDRIVQSRDLVLERYNLFAVLAALCARGSAGRHQQVHLRPQCSFQPKQSLSRRVFSKGSAWVSTLLGHKKMGQT